MTIRKKSSIWPLLFTITGVVVMVGFGTWQLQRLEWKEDLLIQIEKGLKAKPISLPKKLTDIESVEYKRYNVSGIFQHQNEMHLFSTSKTGEPGYHIYTPLIRLNATPIIVNRGWVPEQFKINTTRSKGLIEGIITINGISRVSRQKTKFVPENNIDENRWYYASIEEMAGAASLDNVAPIYLDAEASSAHEGVWPRAGVTRVNLSNRHLEYVFTWYSFAAILLGIFILYRRNQKENWTNEIYIHTRGG